MPKSLLESTLGHFQTVFPSLNLPAPTQPLDQYLNVPPFPFRA